MKVGIPFFPFMGIHPHVYAPVVARADELGFESVWVPEHLVFPAQIPATYPYSDDGVAPITSATPMYDPWVTLAFFAARTERLLLGTSVYILPLRNPFVTARMVGTLDVLSNGRVILGCGIGWLREEFEAVGEAWEDRTSRTTEIVEVIRKLWTEETIEYHGKRYDFGPVRFEPKPVRKPRPPIFLGGESAPAPSRAARLGDGWIGTGHTPDRTREFVRKLNELRREHGREGEPFEVTIGATVPPTLEALREYERAGADRVIVVPWSWPQGPLTVRHAILGMEEFAGSVLSHLGR